MRASAFPQALAIADSALRITGRTRQSFPDDYEVLTSMDKNQWDVAASVTGDSEIKNEGRILTFTAVKARFVRISVTRLS